MYKLKNTILKNIKVLPILEIENNIDPLRLIDAFISANIKVVEITLRNEDAFKNIKLIKKEFPDLIIGVGTILNVEQLKKAFEIGVEFGVSPGLDIEIMNQAKKLEFLYMPGISTASEIMTCLKLNYEIVKFFPAKPLGGITYLKALLGPFPDLLVCPTGGIKDNDYKEWLSIKSVICVGGSWIAPKGFDDYNEIKKRALKITTNNIEE